MNSIKLSTIILATLSLITFTFILTHSNKIKAEEPTKTGQTIFMDAKCNNCHGIVALGIESKSKKKDNPPPDLSNVGAELTSEFIKKYLLKEETLHDKKHAIAFKGSDEDLTMLSEWLATLKTSSDEPPKAE
jgi:cytochrome c553